MPSTAAVQVLLQLSDSLGHRPGWASLGIVNHADGRAFDTMAISAALSDLTDLGYCLLAPFGELVYVTGPGAKLAEAIGSVLRRRVPISELTLEHLAPFLLPRAFHE